MENFDLIFGSEKHISIVQMCLRAILVFIICLLFIRFSGRRVLGMHTPLDNVIAILLGAIMSRAVVGASPFFATAAASATIVILHRFFAWIGFYSDLFGKIVKGEPKILFSDGEFNIENMKKCVITRKDIIESVRINNLDSLDKVKIIFAERNGQISIVKKIEG